MRVRASIRFVDTNVKPMLGLLCRGAQAGLSTAAAGDAVKHSETRAATTKPDTGVHSLPRMIDICFAFYGSRLLRRFFDAGPLTPATQR
jgi:hypothetical protein